MAVIGVPLLPAFWLLASVVVPGPVLGFEAIGFNAGPDSSFLASDGIEYGRDVPFRPGVFDGHYLGTSGEAQRWERLLFYPGEPRDTRMYATWRSGTFGYGFHVTPGDYDLTLRLVEPKADGPGIGVQSIWAEGAPLWENLDIFQEVGKLRSLDVCRRIHVADQRLEVEFRPISGLARVAAIALEPAGMQTPPPVEGLMARPTHGGVLLTWALPVDGRADGFTVSSLDGLEREVYFERTYRGWARVPEGDELRHQVRALGPDGEAGDPTEVSGTLSRETSELRVMRLEIDPADLREMEGALPDKLPVAARLQVDGNWRVGTVRFRGGYTLLQPKKSYKFSIESGGRVDGSNTVNLGANFADPTLVREMSSHDVALGANLPSYAVEPVILFRNDAFNGVYFHLENADEDYLARVGLDPDGRAYKIDCDIGLSETLATLLECAQNIGSDDWYRDDLIHLFQDLDRQLNVDLEWWMDSVFDLDQVMDWYATQVFVENADFTRHNHIFYRPRTGHRWQILPWDMDGVWNTDSKPANFGTPEFPDVWGRYSEIAERIHRIPALQRRYLLRLSELLDGPWSSGSARATIEGRDSQVHEEGAIDIWKRHRESDARYEYEVGDLSAIVADRERVLRASIDSLLPPYWVHLAINEVVAGEGGTRVELHSRAAAPLSLDRAFLMDDAEHRYALNTPWIGPGEHQVHDLPAAFDRAERLALVVRDEAADPVVADEVSISTLRPRSPLGRIPSGSGRFRILPGSSLGSPNPWTPPISMALEVEDHRVQRRERVSIKVRVTASWRESIAPVLEFVVEGEGGVEYPVAPLAPIAVPALGAGESWETTLEFAVPQASSAFPSGRYDLVARAFEPPSDPIAEHFVSLFVDDGPLRRVVINEFCADNVSGVADSTGEFEDWVELYNGGSGPADLGALYLSDDLENDPFAWALPPTQLAAGTRILLWLDGEPEEGPRHAPFRLGRRGEELALVGERAGVPVKLDHVVFGYQDEDWSLGRYPDGHPTWERYDTPTPDRENLFPVLGR